jgi:hypothetical protein
MFSRDLKKPADIQGGPSPVRARVRIVPQHPLASRKKRLNGAVLRMRPEKPKPMLQQVLHSKDIALLKGP